MDSINQTNEVGYAIDIYNKDEDSNLESDEDISSP